jgi:putative phage-type endonuclease
MIKFINLEQRSEAWYDARKGRITGTSFKDLMAAKTTAAYQNLIYDIAAERVSKSCENEDGYENEWMVRGRELEPEARAIYEQLFECEVEQIGFIIPDSDNPYYEWLGISPDGLTHEAMVEIKCPKRSTHMRYISVGKLPSEYRWQVMGQLFVTGLPYCDFMSYYPDLKPFIIRVFPDENDFKAIQTELDILIGEVIKKIELYKNYDYLND